MPGRSPNSSRRFRSRPRARRSISRSIRPSAIRSPAAARMRSCAHPQAHQLSRLSHQDLRLQRGGRQRLPGPHARLLRARRRRGAGGGRARSRLSGLRRARPGGGQRRLERALHLSFPGRQRVAGAAAGALADPRRRARRHHGRRGAGAVRLRQARRARNSMSASAWMRPVSTSATPATRCRSATPWRRDAPRRGEARRARLLPHGHSAHHAGPAGAAARGAGEERQGADRLYQCAWSETGGRS